MESPGQQRHHENTKDTRDARGRYSVYPQNHARLQHTEKTEASLTGHPDRSDRERVALWISGFVCERPLSHAEGLHFIQQASLRDAVDFRSQEAV